MNQSQNVLQSLTEARFRKSSGGGTPSRVVAQLQKFLDLAGVHFRVQTAQTGTQYFYVDANRREVKIRVSNHADAHADSDYSIDPAEGTIAGAKKFLMSVGVSPVKKKRRRIRPAGMVINLIANFGDKQFPGAVKISRGGWILEVDVSDRKEAEKLWVYYEDHGAVFVSGRVRWLDTDGVQLALSDWKDRKKFPNPPMVITEVVMNQSEQIIEDIATMTWADGGVQPMDEPASVVRSFAFKSGKPLARVEKLWKKLIAQGEKRGFKDDRLFTFVVGTLKKILKIDNQFRGKAKEG